MAAARLHGRRRGEATGTTRTTARHLNHSDRDEGTSMVEAAVVIAAVLLLVMVAVQVGLAYHTVQRADATAARAVAAAQASGGDTAAGHEAAAAHLAGAPLNDPSVSVTRSSDLVTATVSASVPRLVPGLTWRITRSAEAPTERFIPEPDRQ